MSLKKLIMQSRVGHRILLVSLFASFSPALMAQNNIVSLEAQLQSEFEGELRLLPDTLVQWAILRNPRVQISEETIEITRWQGQSEAAAFQPEFYINLGRSNDKRQSGLDAEPAIIEDSETMLDAGVRKLLPTGAEVTIGYETRERENTAPSTTDPIGIDDTIGNVKLQIRQPLLRGFAAKQIHGRLIQNEHEIQVARHNLRQQLLSTAFDSLNLYWQLYRVEKGINSTAQALENAQKLLSDTEGQVSAGRLPDGALLEARSGVITRELDYEKAIQRHNQVISSIRKLLNIQRNEADGIQFVTAVTPENHPWSHPIDFNEYLDSVLNVWPNYRIAQERIAQSKQTLLMMRDESLPKLDLVLEYGQSSRDFESRYNRAFNDALNNDFPNWSVRAELTMPLGKNQAGRAKTAIARMEMQQANLQANLVRTELSEELRLRQTEVDAAWRELLQIRDYVDFQAKLMTNERSRFDAGLSSVRDLLAVQMAFTMAELRLADAEHNYELSKLTMQLSDGSLLEEMGVDFGVTAFEVGR